MIRIIRTGISPVVTYTRGPNAGQSKNVVKRQQLCDLYTASPAAYRNGTTVFTFDDDLLRNVAFISVFASTQNNKCCYCQNELDPGIVEHYRPKGKFKQTRGGKEYFPGYYWLAYDWSNLLYACTGCNTSHKGNLFPIYNRTRRARSHGDNYLLESPVLINPLTDKPSTFIYFNKEKIKSRGPNRKGARSIKILGLDRTNLNDARREYLNDIAKYKEALSRMKGTANEAEARRLWAEYISSKKRKHNRFSEMVNCNFPSNYL